jgi:hypothetical protein
MRGWKCLGGGAEKLLRPQAGVPNLHLRWENLHVVHLNRNSRDSDSRPCPGGRACSIALPHDAVEHPRPATAARHVDPDILVPELQVVHEGAVLVLQRHLAFLVQELDQRQIVVVRHRGPEKRRVETMGLDPARTLLIRCPA